MKTIVRLFQVAAVACMLTACESCDEQKWPGKTKSVQIDSEFMTSFTTDIINHDSNADLEAPVCRLDQYGSGTDRDLGLFSIYLTCCWSLADGSHTCTEGFICDSMGDILTFKCKDSDNGLIFTADFPLDQTSLYNEFEFTGGSGKYEGSFGRGVMYCDVISATNFMVHHIVADATLLVRE